MNNRASCESPIRCDQCGGVTCGHCPDVPGFVQFFPQSKLTGEPTRVIVCNLCIADFATSILETKQAGKAPSLPAPAAKQ